MLISPTINNVHGRIRSITGTDPAAGDEISETVPARRRWRLLTIKYSLVTDETIVYRISRVYIDDGTNLLISLYNDRTQEGSLTRDYHYIQLPIDPITINTNTYLPLPNIILAAGFRLITDTLLLQDADNYSAPQLLVEEWIDP
ncbi:hypothetical protein ES707_14848 [subsurface metagenome]